MNLSELELPTELLRGDLRARGAAKLTNQLVY